jgi:hypothetical protein
MTRSKYFPIGTPVIWTERAVSVVRAVETDWRNSPGSLEDVEVRAPQPFGRIVKADRVGMTYDDLQALRALARSGQTYGVDSFTFDIPEGEFGGGRMKLTRWVMRFPSFGRGYVVGLRVRQEGAREPGSYEEPSYLTETKGPRIVLYEIRRNLTSKPILAPVDAVQVDTAGSDWMTYELERSGR